MSDVTTSSVPIPGPRDVRATLDEPDSTPERAGLVVACPPHPQHGGTRSDQRLTAVSDALTSRGIDCLRIDYGEWDEGYGERRDVEQALEWATERTERVGLFGFSFGAGLALLAGEHDAVDAVGALAPPSHLAADLDVTGALEETTVPVLLAVGIRDATVDWEPVVELARERGDRVLEWPADHFFVGQQGDVANEFASFFAETTGPGSEQEGQ